MNSQESGEFVGDYQSMVGVTLGDSGVGFNNPTDDNPSSATTTTYHISAEHLEGTGSGELGHEQIVVVNGDEVQVRFGKQCTYIIINLYFKPHIHCLHIISREVVEKMV